MERLCRRKAVQRISIAVVGFLFSPALVACGESEFDRQIREWQATLDDAKRTFPNCVVNDVNQELLDLVAGVDTFTPRPIPESVSYVTQTAIRVTRRIASKSLQEAARQIILSTQDKNPLARSLYLAKDYSNLAEVEENGITAFSDNEEMRRELTYLASCYSAKSQTLSLPHKIENLKQQRAGQTRR